MKIQHSYQHVLFSFPFGVVYFLINYVSNINELTFYIKFPSPFGVVYFLINAKRYLIQKIHANVSVSFRSYVFSYVLSVNAIYRMYLLISVSFRSYVFSYVLSVNAIYRMYLLISVSFRSCVFSYEIIRQRSMELLNILSFRLFSELCIFLCTRF